MASKKQFLADGRFTTRMAWTRFSIIGGLGVASLIVLIIVLINWPAILQASVEAAAESDSRRVRAGGSIGFIIFPALFAVILIPAALLLRFDAVTLDGRRLKQGDVNRFPDKPGLLQAVQQDFASQDPGRYQRWLDSTKTDGPVRLVPYDVVGGGRFISIGLQKRGAEPPQIIELPAPGAPTRV